MLTKFQLFYGKRSQFVYGREAELSTVSVGRQVCINCHQTLRIASDQNSAYPRTNQGARLPRLQGQGFQCGLASIL